MTISCPIHGGDFRQTCTDGYCAHVWQAKKYPIITDYEGPVHLMWKPFNLGYASLEELKAHVLTTEHRPPFCYVGERVAPSLSAEDIAHEFVNHHNVDLNWLADGAIPALQSILNRWVLNYAPRVELILRARPERVVELRW